MPSDPVILAFDTSAAHCAAALLMGTQIVATRVEEMKRGQAERLMPLLEELLSDHELTWQDVTRIGVGIGPGNFTGIRISVSAARGLALGLNIPAVGVSGFDALRGGTDGIAAIAGPRDTAYLQHGTDQPVICSAEDVPEDAIQSAPAEQMVSNIARLAARRDASTPPAPLYIRAADAAPAKDAPPRILDDA